MHPRIDDSFCSTFSDKHGVIVISLDYPKSPAAKFPLAVNALTDLTIAILEDETLPVDLGKVAMGGCSAGGNLAVGVCQDEHLQGKIHGVVAFYPPVDFSVDKGDKFKLLKGLARERKQRGGSGEIGGKVLPEGHMWMFNWGYVDEGQDLQDPRLSLFYAKRESLPANICVVGCELDVLCWENEEFAEKLAGEYHGEYHGASSSLVWEKNGVRWEKILDEDHGEFSHIIITQRGFVKVKPGFDNILAFGEKKARMAKRGQEMRDGVAEWLFRKVYV